MEEKNRYDLEAEDDDEEMLDLEMAEACMEEAAIASDQQRPALAEEWLRFAQARALISIAQSLAKLASVVVPDSAEGYPPALNVMDTTR